jgi:radical SAM/Cys-rich protein
MDKINMDLMKGKNTIPPAAGDFLKIEPFCTQLSRFGLKLTRGQTTTLQINVGLLCNQACQHCHLEAGPNRKEVMSLETMDEVISFARRGHFQVIDITGGAPELNPNLPFLIQRIAPLVPRLMIRFNLTSLSDSNYDSLIELCRENRVAILASLPSLDIDQMESQRGKGTFKKSIFALKKLNALGYGQEGTGLELDLYELILEKLRKKP